MAYGEFVYSHSFIVSRVSMYVRMYVCKCIITYVVTHAYTDAYIGVVQYQVQGSAARIGLAVIFTYIHQIHSYICS